MLPTESCIKLSLEHFKKFASLLHLMFYVSFQRGLPKVPRSMSDFVSQSVCAFLFFCDAARRRQTSYDVARLLLMAPIDPWRNSTPVFGAAAFCTTKIGDFRASSALSSLTTWSTYSSKRRPLRKDQLGGTKCRYSPYV